VESVCPSRVNEELSRIQDMKVPAGGFLEKCSKHPSLGLLTKHQRVAEAGEYSGLSVGDSVVDEPFHGDSPKGGYSSTTGSHSDSKSGRC
jgi:hypothetical protein